MTNYQLIFQLVTTTIHSTEVWTKFQEREYLESGYNLGAGWLGFALLSENILKIVNGYKLNTHPMYEVYTNPPNFHEIGTYNNSHEYMMEEFWNDERFGGPIYDPLRIDDRNVPNDMTMRL